AGTAPHHAEALAEVGGKVFQPARATNIARAFFHRLQTTERRERSSPRFFRRHACLTQPFHLFFNVRRQLAVEIALEFTSAKYTLPKTHPKTPPRSSRRTRRWPWEELHVSRTSRIASDIRPH